LGIDEPTIPRTVPYLFPDPDRVERWRQPIQGLPGLKVGIGWQGNPAFRADSFRSFPLTLFAPLAQIPGVTLVSLQKGPGEEQIEQNRDQIPLHLLPDLDKDGAFVDTSAVMQHLDLMIVPDTSLAHLAGALGRPVWILLWTGCDWRWLHERCDSPWYPTARLFRQRSLGDWSSVIHEVASALRSEATAAPARTPSTGEPLNVPVAVGELLDKIAILQIKLERMTNESRRANVGRELQLLQGVAESSLPASAELTRLTAQLKTVNEELWEIEDAIRICERDGDFGERFVELARSVYKSNDRRATLKRRINELLSSAIVEEKSYASWQPSTPCDPSP
jgi:hypothetical protein